MSTPTAAALIVFTVVEMAVTPGISVLLGSLNGPVVIKMFAVKQLPVDVLSYARIMTIPNLIQCAFILLVTWLPQLGRIGAQRGRFAVLGFGTVFLGVFVSATGSLLAPFVASAAPDRHNVAATMGALMTIAHIAKLVAFGFIGFAIGSFVPLMAAMIATGALGNWVGELALHHTTEQRFRLVFQLVLTVLALRLLWNVVPDTGWF